MASADTHSNISTTMSSAATASIGSSVVPPTGGVVASLVDDIWAEFNGDKATLRWSVSLDGKKFDSETYKVLAVVPE